MCFVNNRERDGGERAGRGWWSVGDGLGVEYTLWSTGPLGAFLGVLRFFFGDLECHVAGT